MQHADADRLEDMIEPVGRAANNMGRPEKHPDVDILEEPLVVDIEDQSTDRFPRNALFSTPRDRRSGAGIEFPNSGG